MIYPSNMLPMLPVVKYLDVKMIFAQTSLLKKTVYMGAPFRFTLSSVEHLISSAL
jgi:hypothetical protein